MGGTFRALIPLFVCFLSISAFPLPHRRETVSEGVLNTTERELVAGMPVDTQGTDPLLAYMIYDGRENDVETVSEFLTWLQQHNGTTVSGADLTQGLDLVRRRRSAMVRLVQRDPRTAVHLAFATAQYRPLVPQMEGELEETYQGTGHVGVLCSLVVNGQQPGSSGDEYTTTFEIQGVRYTAYVYGMMQKLTSATVTAHGAYFREERIVALAEGPITNSTDGLIFRTAEDYAALESDFSSNMTETAHIESAGSQIGLVIVMDFEDDPGFPNAAQGWNAQKVADLFTNQISPFFTVNSYGKLQWQWVFSSLVRMPNTKEFYMSSSGNYQQLFGDAAQAAGFDISKHTTYVGLHSKMGKITWSGLGFVGSPGVLANGEFSVRVIAHEIGHNMGSWHANSWLPTTTGQSNYIGQGKVLQYADQWAAMGIADSTGRRHFSARTKHYYGWIPDDNVVNVRVSGTYTLHAHDTIDSLTAGKLVLRIPVQSALHRLTGLTYELEYRQLDVHTNSAGEGTVLLRYVLDPKLGFTISTCASSDVITQACSQLQQSNGLTIDLTPESTPDDVGESRDGGFRPTVWFDDYDSKLHIRLNGLATRGPVQAQDIDIIYGTNDCWGNGNLTNAKCTCSSGFNGVDCSGTNDGQAILRLKDGAGTVTMEWAMGLLREGLGTAAVDLALHERAAGQTIMHLRFGDPTTKAVLRMMVGNGDSKLEKLNIVSVTEGILTITWPRTEEAGTGGLTSQTIILIVGGVAGALLLLLLLACVVLLHTRQQKRQLQLALSRQATRSADSLGDYDACATPQAAGWEPGSLPGSPLPGSPLPAPYSPASRPRTFIPRLAHLANEALPGGQTAPKKHARPKGYHPPPAVSSPLVTPHRAIQRQHSADPTALQQSLTSLTQHMGGDVPQRFFGASMDALILDDTSVPGTPTGWDPASPTRLPNMAMPQTIPLAQPTPKALQSVEELDVSADECTNDEQTCRQTEM